MFDVSIIRRKRFRSSSGFVLQDTRLFLSWRFRSGSSISSDLELFVIISNISKIIWSNFNSNPLFLKKLYFAFVEVLSTIVAIIYKWDKISHKQNNARKRAADIKHQCLVKYRWSCICLTITLLQSHCWSGKCTGAYIERNASSTVWLEASLKVHLMIWRLSRRSFFERTPAEASPKVYLIWFPQSFTFKGLHALKVYIVKIL